MKNEQINEQLDSISLLMLECYDEILNKRNELNGFLDDAFLNLSKARSLIGCSSLSILQVPTELEPNVTVNEQTIDQTDSDIKYQHLNYELTIENKQKTALSNEKPIPTLPTWFGVLTPLSLKTSHKSFSQSLYVIKSICELQSKLANLQLIYSDLKKQLN